jgi:3-oxoacyl-[acyl-carrier protein] reductase
MVDISGKWALVTGSSRGIGKEIALALAKQGCNIILHASKKENCQSTLNLIKKCGVKFEVIGASLSSEDGVSSLINSINSLGILPDIIYNNAGFQNEWKDVWDITPSEWRDIFQVNLFATAQICNEFIPKMKKKGWGRVINSSSDIENVPELSPYGAAKAAIDKMVKEYSVALEGSGVKIFAMDPGWVRTDLGGPDADHSVEEVIPGALAPLLLNDIKSGSKFTIYDYSNI